MKAFRTADENNLCKRRRLHKYGGDFLMRPFTRSLYRAGLIGGAALALSLAPMNATGQQVSTQTAASAQANDQNSNPDLRNWELARMDQFLDDHQQIDQQLTANPSLINDQKYLAQHQDLQLFLSNHPRVREEFAENPTFFVNRENRFDAQEALRSRTGQPNRNPNPDLRNWELARMDQFLDDHQQIDQQLTANPSLINDQKYLAQHQDLQMFLSNHPQVREEFAENPTFFMNRENRFDTQEALRSRTDQPNGNTNPDRDQDRDRNFADRDQDRDRDANRQNPNPDLRNWELARMDQFLDDHQQIDKDLTTKPSLINDQKYLSQHRDLQMFLSNHPQVREEFAENPTFFMNRENRFDAQEALRSRTGQPNRNINPDRDQDRDQNPNPDLRNWELARMDQFLDDHQQIDKNLTAKPSLINDQKYLAQHKDLQMFLSNHPQVREEFAENPTYFMHRENRFDSREFAERADANRNNSRSNSNAAPNVTEKQSTQMDQFLDKHKDIDRDLGKNPSLCNDDKYLKHHKDLRAFLDKNPEVRTQVASNSAYFNQRHERMQDHHAPVKGTKPVKKPAPAKTPIEQHETTTPAAPTH